MLKKIRLDRTRTYELALATKYIAEMLDAFIEGRSHFKSLGCEQGDIDKWDDLVIDLGNDVFKHIQVKRQLTDFSKLPVDRGIKSKDKNKGKPQDLSPLDESLAGLAQWSKGKTSEELITRRFVIEVPDYTVQIKKGYQVRHFEELCSLSVNKMTTESALVSLAALDPKVNNAHTWLTTWCGFEGWGHILKSLQLLEVRCSGLVGDIENETETTLSRHFSDGARARKLINFFIDENSSYSVAIQPRQILSELESELILDRERWTQFKKNMGNWEISGICDLQGNDIETPVNFVQNFWNSNQKNSFKIITSNQSDNINCKLSTPLIRFLLHFEGTSSAVLNELDTWKSQARHAISDTLGISEDDFQSLNWSPSSTCPSSSSSSEYRELRLTRELEKEATCFSDEMYNVTWRKVCEVLTKKISKMVNKEIRDAIEDRWFSWKSNLELNFLDRNNFLKNMLHPKSEGEDVYSELRVGPKSVNMLAEGIQFLLIVSTALSDKGDCWKTTQDDRRINTLALGYWGGPSGKPRYARELTDEDGIEQLLGNELNSILIMSQIKYSPSDVLDESLAFTLEEKDSLAISKTPDLLVTNSLKFRRLINRGTLQDIKTFFEESLKSREQVREKSIQGVING